MGAGEFKAIFVDYSHGDDRIVIVHSRIDLMEEQTLSQLFTS